MQVELTRAHYPSDITDEEWERVAALIPGEKPGGRHRSTEERSVLNACFYLIRTGIAWRYLPKSFPPWRTVYGYFHDWAASGMWESINFTLSAQARLREGRKIFPTLAIADAQTVRAQYGEERGYDAIKKARGRKRNILVDALGFVWGLHVHAGNEIDAKGGLEALRRSPVVVRKSIEKIIADSVYKWPMDYCAYTDYKIRVENIDKKKLGTNMKPKRWIVERTFAWFNRFRRLSRDYEKRTLHSEAMIYLAMITILLRRLRT
jgi:transposase